MADNLSTRIREAWLKRNPARPDWTHEEADAWVSAQVRLSNMLDIGAYESAVIQFLVPPDKDYTIFREQSRGVASVGNRPDLDDQSPAEALLSAIEAAEASDA